MANLLGDLPGTDRMPVLFIGHGSPMNAIADNTFTRQWREIGKGVPAPRAILSVSAHWLTEGTTKVTAMQEPRTIHDFRGFPPELYAQRYPAPGSPELAAQTIELVRSSHVEADHAWGLDHGTWSVLGPMFPDANVPTFQLSIDYSQAPRYHFELARELAALRRRGVLIIGSGNLVHNLGAMRSNAPPFDWAVEFRDRMVGFLREGDLDGVVDFQKLGAVARAAHPSHDHFLPLLYAIGLIEPGEPVTFFTDAFDLGSISMLSMRVS